MRNANHRLTLRSRPVGLAGADNFAEDTVPVRAPESGEVLLETLLLSIDPAMRVWISENPGYVPRVEIGEVMRAGAVGPSLPISASRACFGWAAREPSNPFVDFSLSSATNWPPRSCSSAPICGNPI